MKYFIEVVKQGGMTNASKSLYIAQPTISKAIKDIENEMGTPLFDRSKRHLILTDAGQIFYEKSKEIVALYDYLPSEMERLNGLETGHVGSHEYEDSYKYSWCIPSTISKCYI